MSRGRNAGFLSIALLALSAVALSGGPALSALTVSSGSAGGYDNLAPGPVSDLAVEVDLGGPSVTISWAISANDFTRQTAASSDFTSGGTFVNVNDVPNYNIYRGELDGELTLLVSLGSGVTSYVDNDVEAGITYVYAVSAIDDTGNESDKVESDAVNLGPPPTVELEAPEEMAPVVVEVTMTFEGEVDVADEDAVDKIIADFLAALEAQGIDTSRITNIDVSSGSIVITFEVAEDEEDAEAGSALEVVAAIDEVVEDAPEAFAEVGGAPSLASTTTGSLALGNAEIDEVVTGTFSFANNAEDPDAILTISPTVAGDGFSASVTSLSLAVGESGDIDVLFTAADVGNMTGNYTGSLTLNTNDPNNRTTLIDLSASIDDGLKLQAIDLSSESLGFANVTTGTSRTINLTVRNTGDLDLDVAFTLSGDDAFSWAFSDTVVGKDSRSTEVTAIEGSGSLVVKVTFAPTLPNAAEGTITITSNDEENPTVTVSLTGAGMSATAVEVLVDANGEQILGDFVTTGSSAGKVDFDDFFAFADQFNTNSEDTTWNADFDINQKGDSLNTINFDDFFVFADNFNKSGTYQVLGSANTADGSSSK